MRMTPYEVRITQGRYSAKRKSKRGRRVHMNIWFAGYSGQSSLTIEDQGSAVARKQFNVNVGDSRWT